MGADGPGRTWAGRPRFLAGPVVPGTTELASLASKSASRSPRPCWIISVIGTHRSLSSVPTNRTRAAFLFRSIMRSISSIRVLSISWKPRPAPTPSAARASCTTVP